MPRLTPLRIAFTSLLVAAAVASTGLAWSWLRFGFSEAGLAARVEQDVRRTVATHSTAAQSLAQRVAAQAALIAEAQTSRDRLAALFEYLQSIAESASDPAVAVTVYVPGASPREYRVLAWSDGPGKEDLSADRLERPSDLFVAPGHAGLRLVAEQPVLGPDGQTIAVAVAETVLAPVDRSSDLASDGSERRLDTRYGPVSVIAQSVSTRHATDTHGFSVTSDSGAPLIEVNFEPETLLQHRRAFQRRALAIALLVLPLGLSLLSARLLDTHRRPSTPRARWVRASLQAVGTALVATAVAAIAMFADMPRSVITVVMLIGILAIVIRLSAILWWHAGRRRVVNDNVVRFAVEHLLGGVLLAASIEVIARGLERWITIAVLDRGPFVLFPFSAPHVLSIGTVLLGETDVAWVTTSVLAALAIRWRVTRRVPRLVAASILWLLPAAVMARLPWTAASRTGWLPLAAAVIAAVVFALAAGSLHRAYRRTTRSNRLLLALLAGIAPLIALYPLAATTAARATRHVIESVYAPATEGHPRDLRAELRRAQDRIDEMPVLADLVGAIPSTDSQPAYIVWNKTGLERSRVISDVELYGPTRTLVSRFAFNLPEYVYRTTPQPWEGSSCSWEVFGEVTAFGAEDRRMLHAERGICDADGRLLGGVVVHVARDDYKALPFVSSPSPYFETIGVNASAGPRLPGVALAVYGWSSRPMFTTGPAAWAVEPAVFERLYQTGEPFWTEIAADDDTYHVHFSQNRSGVYAIGVPRVSAIEHSTRLAEIIALVCVFFVLWQVGLLIYAPLARQPNAPLHRVFHEVRTSFYRKLFLSFVIANVVPVLAAAVAFGGYMTARFRADVEYEAATTVAVAQRVFQELTAGERSIELQATPSDDVMVWIRQVIDQDVNLFDGSEIIATSQRDLFDSGLLPTRTPAAVYRAIALERRPVAVAEDRIGTFSYVVAAAPVSAWGRNAVLIVPLAPRQREIEREIDTFNRRVLVGAVLVVLFAAGIGASLARRISDPVAQLTRATRQIAAGHLDVRVATDTGDELRRLVDDFNSMAARLDAQRTELARANQLKAWNEMARQVAHEIKNPLTPIQLAAEHLHQVHEDRGRPLGVVVDRCLDTVLAQVRLLRQIASEFANFAGEPTRRPIALQLASLLQTIIEPYRVGFGERVKFDVQVPADLPPVLADRTLLSRALTNLVENAVQAMPGGGTLRLTGRSSEGRVVLTLVDDGVGMDAVALEHAFEPYFSTKTAGSGLGLANARRNIEREGGTITIASEAGRGTTVTVTLPEAPAPASSSSSAPEPSR